MWFIQRYMQFGFCALDETIHVSDQPVAPSVGLVDSTGWPSAFKRLTWSGHVVPMTLSLLANDWICLS